MKVKISPSRLCGEISAPPSKSYAHRLMICAALAEGESTIHGISESEDMLATLDCIAALGARYEKLGDTVKICGKTGKTPEGAVLRCRESGSTLRFMIPPALTGGRVRFEGTPRLLERGVGIYEQLLGDKGIEIKKDSGGIEFFGALTAGEYVLRGDVSSQFITGLLFALPLLSGDSVIKILPPVESRAYIDITAAALGSFGIKIAEHEKNTFAVPGGQRYAAGDKTVEGDWSNAAALEAFNLIGGRVNVNGLNENSIQGDRVCLEYFRELTRPGAELDISNCPDLGPVLFALAAATGNGARFTGTRRLTIKESNRAEVMAKELSKFGARLIVEENSVEVAACAIHAPAEPLSGSNDHRIVMALSILAARFGGEIQGAEAVRKSYPNFFEDLRALGVSVRTEGET